MVDNYQKAAEVPDDEKASANQENWSWLGRWEDIGWSIRIVPKLTSTQWMRATAGLRACWDAVTRNYDPILALELLGDMFPTHTAGLVWPRCTKRCASGATNARGLPYYVPCGAVAQHTDTRIQDVHGIKHAVPRCEAHRGQL